MKTSISNKNRHKSQLSLNTIKKQEKSPITIEEKEKEQEPIISNIISDQEKITKEINNKKNKDTSFQNIQRKDFYTYANLVERCNEENCPAPNSCISAHICQCSEEKANFEEDAYGNYDTQKVYCNYTRKKQLIAFVLEFVLISAGHFYIGSYLLGSLKLILFFCALVIANRFDEKWSRALSTILFSMVGIWWTIDSGLFAVNFYPDQNKVLLMEW